MTTKPEALQLARLLEIYDKPINMTAAAELRRLHEVNAELLKALIEIEANYPSLWAGERASEAIAKATGEQYEN